MSHITIDLNEGTEEVSKNYINCEQCDDVIESKNSYNMGGSHICSHCHDKEVKNYYDKARPMVQIIEHTYKE